MAELPSPSAVSLSRPLGSETPRHLGPRRDSGDTSPETVDLKALARLVLIRDIRRDSNRDGVSRDHDATETPARQFSSDPAVPRPGETATEIPTLLPDPNLSENQSLAGVSLSRVPGGETPETATDAWADPVLLRDGGRLHRIAAAAIPAVVPERVRMLMQTVRGYSVRLWADGKELIVIEPWGGMLPESLFGELRKHAGAMIALLRGESRARAPGVTSELPEPRER
jgi:hypothetical protein